MRGPADRRDSMRPSACSAQPARCARRRASALRNTADAQRISLALRPVETLDVERASFRRHRRLSPPSSAEFHQQRRGWRGAGRRNARGSRAAHSVAEMDDVARGWRGLAQQHHVAHEFGRERVGSLARLTRELDVVDARAEPGEIVASTPHFSAGNCASMHASARRVRTRRSRCIRSAPARRASRRPLERPASTATRIARAEKCERRPASSSRISCCSTRRPRARRAGRRRGQSGGPVPLRKSAALQRPIVAAPIDRRGSQHLHQAALPRAAPAHHADADVARAAASQGARPRRRDRRLAAGPPRRASISSRSRLAAAAGHRRGRRSRPRTPRTQRPQSARAWVGPTPPPPSTLPRATSAAGVAAGERARLGAAGNAFRRRPGFERQRRRCRRQHGGGAHNDLITADEEAEPGSPPTLPPPPAADGAWATVRDRLETAGAAAAMACSGAGGAAARLGGRRTPAPMTLAAANCAALARARRSCRRRRRRDRGRGGGRRRTILLEAGGDAEEVEAAAEAARARETLAQKAKAAAAAAARAACRCLSAGRRPL